MARRPTILCVVHHFLNYGYMIPSGARVCNNNKINNYKCSLKKKKKSQKGFCLTYFSELKI